MWNSIDYFLFAIPALISAFWTRRDVSRIKLYADVPDDQKPLVDADGLKRIYFIFWMIEAVWCAAFGVLNYFIGFDFFSFLVLILIVDALAMPFLKKYSYRCFPPEVEVPDNKRFSWILFAVLTAIVVVVLIVDHKQTEIEVTANCIEVAGEYDYVVPRQCIQTIEIVEALPRVKNSEGGYWKFGQVYGEYRLKDGSECTFLLLDKTAPFLKMNTCNGIIYLNGKTPDATLQLAEEIRENFGDKFLNQ